jgi:CheY-like chemotaxis protein
VNREVVLGQLRNLGYSADIAVDGLEAVEAVQQRPYDAILMDCSMPRLDGYAATRRIRDWEHRAIRLGGGRRVRIIAMTAHCMVGDREKCLAAGMDDYLSKPLLIEELHAALGRVVPGAAPRRAPDAPLQPTKPMDDTPSPPVINHGTLDRIRQLGDPKLLLEVIDLFLAETPSAVNQLRAALRRPDWKAGQVIAHTLKGSASNLGADRLASLFREIEHQAKAGVVPQAAAKLQTVDQELAAACEALRLIRARDTAAAAPSIATGCDADILRASSTG